MLLSHLLKPILTWLSNSKSSKKQRRRICARRSLVKTIFRTRIKSNQFYCQKIKRPTKNLCLNGNWEHFLSNLRASWITNQTVRKNNTKIGRLTKCKEPWTLRRTNIWLQPNQPSKLTILKEVLKTTRKLGLVSQ
jgi:hypothetical protein